MTQIKIDATPQKRLFLSIIADYDLRTSICELIDNALDHWLASNCARPLQIKLAINVDRQRIRIIDNAGGVCVDRLELLVAPGASRENSDNEVIGNFGVGGKRAGVALGERVEIKSRFQSAEKYSIVLDNGWLSAESNWEIFASRVDHIDAASTEVTISELRQGISAEDVLSLEDMLGETYANFLNNECVLTINDSPVLREKFDYWAYPPDYLPKKAKFTIQPLEGSSDAVHVEITAGLISDRDPKEGNYGVYFYCNKRLIVAHEKSPEVGYYKGKAGTPHPDASISRVIVELTGKPELMPWTSNKAGINWNHPTFQLIRDRIVEMTTFFTTVSRRTKSDREGQVFQFDSGEIESMDLSSSESLKKIVHLPTPRGRRKPYADRILIQNASITESKPWTLGLVEAMSMFEILSNKSYESRNRLGLIILDSSLEIGLKEFLVNHPNEFYSDSRILDLFKQRHLVVEEVKRHVTIESSLWQKARHYNLTRNKLIHERATVQITDSQLDDFRRVVEHILNKLFGFDFSRD